MFTSGKHVIDSYDLELLPTMIEAAMRNLSPEDRDDREKRIADKLEPEGVVSVQFGLADGSFRNFPP